jgi:hypothetical protein
MSYNPPAALSLPAAGGQLFYGDSNSPETWQLITNMGGITGLGLSAQVVDVTNNNVATQGSGQNSTWRAKVPTLLDSGDVTFDLYFIPSDPGHKALLKLFTMRGTTVGGPNVPIYFKYVFPDSGGTTWFFQGFVTKLMMTGAIADNYKLVTTITTTGAPTFPA